MGLRAGLGIWGLGLGIQCLGTQYLVGFAGGVGTVEMQARRGMGGGEAEEGVGAS